MPIDTKNTENTLAKIPYLPIYQQVENRIILKIYKILYIPFLVPTLKRSSFFPSLLRRPAFHVMSPHVIHHIYPLIAVFVFSRHRRAAFFQVGFSCAYRQSSFNQCQLAIYRFFFFFFAIFYFTQTQVNTNTSGASPIFV